MTKNRKPHEDIRFSVKKLSGAGILSVLFSASSLILFPVSVFVSCQYGGQAGMQVGAMGMLALIIGLIGTALGISESHNDEVNRRVPRTGARLGTLAVLLWIGMILIGLKAL